MTNLWNIISEMQSTDERELETMAENAYNQAIDDVIAIVEKIQPKEDTITQILELKYK